MEATHTRGSLESETHLTFETAAEHATPRVPIAGPVQLVGEIRELLVGQRYESASHSAVCEVDKFLGIVTIEDLLSAPADATVQSLMEPGAPIVAPGLDQEVAAWRAVRHGESALAVVDRHGHFVGMIPPHRLLGVIRINGERIDNVTEAQMMKVRGDIGMLFQESALFDSLTVADNVGYRLYEQTDMPAQQVRGRIEEVLGFIGLEEYIDRMPAELSGGQRRRVAIARAMAAKPVLLLFDPPTSGLDPITAKTVDAEVIKLRDLEHVTSILVTHQLEDAFYVATHEAVRENERVTIVPADQRKADEVELLMLKDGRIHFEGSAVELRASKDPYLKKFVS
jgi:phospholipid/cholesterol/gamma-HCH transport system ATP-binding protein